MSLIYYTMPKVNYSGFHSFL